MKKIILISLIFFLSNCSKPKTVLICGDHICINNSEAEQYFEENLSIEVKVINKKIKKQLDLVELNLKENQKGKKEITITSKVSINKNLKTLTNEEVAQIKNKIKKKKKDNKVIKEVYIEKETAKKLTPSVKKIKSHKNQIKNINKNQKNVTDICTILKKCSIDEISKYLLKEGKKKGFPNITLRQ